MKHATLVDATDLDAWADRLDGRFGLPRLLRRLVVATTSGLRRVAFRAGEGTQLPGWDGLTETGASSTWVPAGLSVWEVGAGADCKAKADADFDKRSKKPLDVIAKDTTFVFATLRRWPGKDAWLSTRRLEGLWREVRAYDADDLEAWLEAAPGVHLALSRAIGKPGAGAVDLESWWEDWIAETEPRLSAQLLMAGREQVVGVVKAWLDSALPTSLAVQTESKQETLALLAAIIVTLPEDDRDRLLANALLVRDRDTWDTLASLQNPLLLVPWFRDNVQGAVSAATRKGKSVFVPLDRDTRARESTLAVPRVSWDAARRALEAMGCADTAARSLATLARRSLLALRRKIATNPELQQPAWATPESARLLLPLVLTGAWEHRSEADRAVVQAISGVSYDEVQSRLSRWANVEDPPFRRIGDAWLAASKEDAWSLVGGEPDASDLKRFFDATVGALAVPDPRFDLPIEKRLVAAALRHDCAISPLLMESLAESTAMLGARGFSRGSRICEQTADAIVRELFGKANADWRVWATVASTLPRLAEAAPDTFLNAVEVGLAPPATPLLKLFEDQGDTMFSTSPHTGLLWALEVLAWSPAYLTRVVLALGALSRLEPGGKTLNRPMASLERIFLQWLPQTTASLADRLKALDRLRAKEPAVAWVLLRNLLPHRANAAVFTNAEPAWRDWIPEDRNQRADPDYRQAVGAMVERLLLDVSADEARWAELAGKLDTLPPAEFQAAVSRLRELDPSALSPTAQERLWEALRDRTSTHRNSPEADWALPSEHIDQLQALALKFTPSSPIPRHAWLFDYMPHGFVSEEDDWAATELKLRTARRDAATQVFGSSGPDGLIALAARAPVPGLVGDVAGELVLLSPNEEAALLQTCLGHADGARANLARGYAIGRHRSAEEWPEAVLSDQAMAWTPQQQAAFLLCLPPCAETWDRAESFGEETHRRYWEAARPYPLGTAGDCARAARALVSGGRTSAAIELLGLMSGKKAETEPPPELVREVLEAFARAPGPAPLSSMIAYYTRRLLDGLVSCDAEAESHAAALEWRLLPLLEDQGGPRYLHRELQRNPQFFGLLISLFWPAEDAPALERSADERLLAERAFRVLQGWRLLPGLSDSGEDASEVLAAWVLAAREVVASENRGGMGDNYIGRILACGPHGADGHFPHPAVRQIIEEADSREIEAGFCLAIFNSRGVFTKDPCAGGDQERDLAKRYREHADAVAAEWPRTAATLRVMEKRYLDWADREDAQGTLRHDMY